SPERSRASWPTWAAHEPPSMSVQLASTPSCGRRAFAGPTHGCTFPSSTGTARSPVTAAARPSRACMWPGCGSSQVDDPRLSTGPAATGSRWLTQSTAAPASGAPPEGDPRMEHCYDVVIVGARCAGAATALLLARRGFRVALLDRAPAPGSDTLSTHALMRA